MLSKKVELIILNAVLIAGITASGIVTWKSNQTVEAAAAPMVIQAGPSSESSSQSWVDTSRDESATIDKICRATANGDGCSNCGACTGQCGFRND